MQLLRNKNRSTHINYAIIVVRWIWKVGISILRGNHVSYISNISNNTNGEKLTWIIDSGITDHICSNKELFSKLISLPQSHFFYQMFN